MGPPVVRVFCCHGQAISGTNHERDYVKAIGAASDPVQKLTIYAGAMRQIQARVIF
jgi:hypothetical protein